MGNDRDMFDDFKKCMMNEFEMTDLGLMRYFLGIEVVQSSVGVFISQKIYTLEILDRFNMKDWNSVSTPTELGLKLTRKGTSRMIDATLYKQIVGSLMYLTSTRPDIMYAVSLISRYMENPTQAPLLVAKRIFCYLKAVTWSSKKQPIVTLSTTEAEFVAAASSSCQAI
nr:uncharacterized mitochondrial protein AtMg00810-like [Ziziphus jujuba var. spinosa]